MSGSTKFSVAMPWNLSNYILLNGFHPLYRALVDHAPDNVTLNAWDNVKLHRRLAGDPATREALLAAANEAKRTPRQSGPVAGAYRKYFWPPNEALTSQLSGDIEFHHTAPFPSMERPFVFHCESFAPVFIPLARQGSGAFEHAAELREHYRRLFADPLCLGIFSHVPETLDSFRRFFADAQIDRKLFASPVGLSGRAIDEPALPAKPALSRPRFLFVNSANQNTANFFLRGGHRVLRFWKRFRADGRDGLLILRCGRPDDEDLAEYGVDTAFLEHEIGRSIIWAQDYLANHEMNALVANSHFFLLPSASLHSVSIMQAMSLGAVPVVTDTIGTSVYVNDGVDGIVLSGVRAAIWSRDPGTGIEVDSYARTAELDEALVVQLAERVDALLARAGGYDAMRASGMERAKVSFDGKAFAKEFWSAVTGLYAGHPSPASAQAGAIAGIRDCTLRGDDWARVFESGTQPMRRIFTSQSTVTELGGAILHTYGNPEIELNDWAVMAQYWKFGSPPMNFVNTIADLNGVYLNYVGEGEIGIGRKFTRFIGKLLMPYPALHGFASAVLSAVVRKVRRYRRHIEFRRSLRAARADTEVQVSRQDAAPQAAASDDPLPRNPKLVVEGYYGFNIIHLRRRFYAVLQGEGAFEVDKIGTSHYSRSFAGDTLPEVQQAIHASLDAEAPESAGARH